ncbi:TetR/AcrR family transcriptional regulator [Listeria monocytogenes]|uniref:TetR/AcrR family transcriptional regulator n=1 Tax=Listeria monocytogenes TaxID=1639 RepID=UPI0010D4CCA8|nr:TetR/AcrR family transcriptional regulator [Listeria monocytogenes]EAE0857447.1 TetR/AcrR family transcriptional regulator [Listeria monocytogenes]EAE1574927.1 TetR/AcrR family transcriptional regulator [Listeria monocytogenes]EBF5122243.1 TetR/AcrR family transcriptional regulator [Listeria monocytogenes]EGP4510049.1 TetR/AcrR family transcriptional regulator [Listeria monocytogenes]EHD5595305.1 TetR/AcrR family transcriptional regulator [Listeria monocytogenes]
MDRRVKKTKKAFNQALFTLLDQKPFQQITITDIVAEADVNRGTFYKHYRDKEQLLDSIIEEILTDLKNAYQDPYLHTTHFSIQALTPSMIKIFDHVYSHQAFYRQVIKSTIRPSFQNQVCNVIRELILDDVASFPDSSGANPQLLATYQAHAIFGMIVFWAEEDFSHSPAYMSEQLLHIIHAKTQQA